MPDLHLETPLAVQVFMMTKRSVPGNSLAGEYDYGTWPYRSYRGHNDGAKLNCNRCPYHPSLPNSISDSLAF